MFISEKSIGNKNLKLDEVEVDTYDLIIACQKFQFRPIIIHAIIRVLNRLGLHYMNLQSIHFAVAMT